MIDKHLILLDKFVENKEEAINMMANQAQIHGYINDVALYIEKVISRENEFSTAIGYDVAIPHGKTNAVSEPFIVLLRPESPLSWGTEKVKLIFMLGVPESEQKDLHLKILSTLSKKLLDSQFREGLLEENLKDILRELTNIEDQIIQNRKERLM